MNARSGQLAIVLILGSALLIYGGATGRLADAWKALTGNAPAQPATSTDPNAPQPGDQSGEPTNTDPPLTGSKPGSVAMVYSSGPTGQMIPGQGGWHA